jgi:hypothetical protein
VDFHRRRPNARLQVEEAHSWPHAVQHPSV